MLSAKLVTATSSIPTPGYSWQSRFLRSSIFGIAWSSTLGLYAAVGRVGVIYTSPDGITWTQRTSPITSSPTDIVWTGTAFVAVGGTNAIRSTNGTTWTTQASSMGSPNSVAASSSVVVTVGLNGSVRRSTDDGISFTTSGTSGTSTLNSVVWASAFGVFVAVGGTGVRTSPDGVTWTLTQTISGAVLKSVAFNQTGPSSGLLVISTTNGTIYTSTTTSTFALGNHLPGTFTTQDLTFGNGLFTAVSSEGAIYTNPNPSTTAWTLRVSSSPLPLYATIWNGAQYIAIGSGFSTYISATGSTWTLQNTGTLYTLNGVDVGSGLLVAVGNSGAILTSTDGSNWTVRTSGVTTKLNAVAWSSSLNRWVAVGATDTVLYSSNGISWTSTTTSYSESLADVTWDGSLFWAVSSDSNKVFSSSDGINWNLPQFVTSGGSSSIASDGAGNLVISRLLGNFAYSSNSGSSWTQSSFSGTLYNVSWTGTLFICTTSGGGIYTSPTGATWTTRTSGISQPLYASAAASSNNVVVLGGLNPSAGATVAVVSVNDTVSWSNATTQTNDTFNGAIYFSNIGRYVAVGLNGQIALSAPVSGLAQIL